MGLTEVEAEVFGSNGLTEKLSFLVDSGATYSLLPTETWKRLAIEPTGPFQCMLADGSRIRRQVGECRIEIAGKKGTTPVILGEPGDEPLLGVVTLETLGLVLDPLKRILFPLVPRL